MLGFFLLLLISFVVTGFQISGLKQFNRYFNTFQSSSASTNLMLQINKDVSELQRHISIFSNTEKITTINQIKDLHHQLLEDINLLIESDSVVNTQQSNLLNQMRTAVEAISGKIDLLQSEKEQRDSMININLANIYMDMENTVDNVFRIMDKTRNNKFLDELWIGEHYLDQSQMLTNRYFSKHEFRLKKDVITSLYLVEKTFKSILSDIKDVNAYSQINSVVENLAKARVAFNQAVQADRNYLFLVNVVLAGESAEISNISEKLRTDFLNEQARIVASTDEQIARIRNIVLISAIMGAVLAALIALYIGNRIRKPIHSITNTFTRLAQGENLLDIPGSDRRDEIGKLANAANVFRQTNVRTQELLAKTEEFTEELKKRSIELEIAVNKAKSANEAKSQFLANMSHELRTPMNAILGMLSLLQKTELNSRQKDYALKTESAAKSLLSLLNDILDLSKAEAGKMELDPIGFNLDKVLFDLKVILNTNIGSKPVELIVDIDEKVPRYLFGDSLRLQQILINLGGNAIKFTQQGYVAISVELNSILSNSVNLKFSVKDSGIGIAPENHQKIFSGFTQAESSTTRRFGGTGLGLAISQRLVAMMGGSLNLQSELNVGSCFFFFIEIPLLSAEEIVALENKNLKKENNNNLKRLDSMKILLVEDNPTNQQIALELLQAEGAWVDVANDGQEAINFLSKNLKALNSPGVDLVLMDLQMPGMDGITATRFIRNQLDCKTLPIVAMTANAMKSDRDACIESGMNEHLGKPFDLEHVIKVLRAQTGWSEIKVDKKLTSIDQPITSEQIKEFDFQGAIARMGGNEALYRKMLPKFIENLSKLPDKLNELLLSPENIPKIAHEMHSLKGIAVTMGALHLSEQVGVIEKKLKENPDDVNAAEMVKSVCNLIQAASKHLILFLDQH